MSKLTHSVDCEARRRYANQISHRVIHPSEGLRPNRCLGFADLYAFVQNARRLITRAPHVSRGEAFAHDAV